MLYEVITGEGFPLWMNLANMSRHHGLIIHYFSAKWTFCHFTKKGFKKIYLSIFFIRIQTKLVRNNFV